VNDLNTPDGVEVYSKLRSSRLTKEKAWDGKVMIAARPIGDLITG